jgi:hypothetical protein
MQVAARHMLSFFLPTSVSLDLSPAPLIHVSSYLYHGRGTIFLATLRWGDLIHPPN